MIGAHNTALGKVNFEQKKKTKNKKDRNRLRGAAKKKTGFFGRSLPNVGG